MTNRRLLFAVIIKILIFVGVILLCWVLINSLFVTDNTSKKIIDTEQAVASIDITDMHRGQIKKIRWNKQEVAILLRQFPQKIKTLSTIDENLDSSLNRKSRSKKIEYFVYFNTGDSRNCPLFYAAGIFKDVCSSNTFDETGRAINNTVNGFSLNIPPHYFEKNVLVIGKWAP